ncbi:DUF2887 domain-containing protein, partial [Nostoc sp. UCD121]
QQPYRSILDSSQIQRIYLDELGTANENSLQLAIMQLIIASEAIAIDQGRQLIIQARQELTDEANKKQIVELIETILL